MYISLGTEDEGKIKEVRRKTHTTSSTMMMTMRERAERSRSKRGGEEENYNWSMRHMKNR